MNNCLKSSSNKGHSSVEVNNFILNDTEPFVYILTNSNQLSDFSVCISEVVKWKIKTLSVLEIRQLLKAMYRPSPCCVP